MIQRRNVRELGRVSAANLAEELGGLPEASFHAAQLAEEGVKALEREIGVD
jgi:HEPN domain-containing protein